MMIGPRSAPHIEDCYDVICVLQEHPNSTIREVAFYLSDHDRTMATFFKTRDAEHYLSTARSTVLRLVKAGLIANSGMSSDRRRYVLTQEGKDWREMSDVLQTL